MIAILASEMFILWFCIIAAVGMVISLEVESEGWASGLFSMGIALVLWNYWESIWAFVSLNYLNVIYFSLGYVVLGIVWSFFKWEFKVKDVFVKFSELKAKFVKEHGELNSEKEDYDKQLTLFKSEIKYAFKNNEGHKISFDSWDTFKDIVKKIAPNAFENKAKITSWISYWPLSLTGTLLNRPFKRFFGWVYLQVSGLYEKISQRHIQSALNTEK